MSQVSGIGGMVTFKNLSSLATGRLSQESSSPSSFLAALVALYLPWPLTYIKEATPHKKIISLEKFLTALDLPPYQVLVL